MKFKIAIKSLIMLFISVSALGSPTDDFFVPGGLWQGQYSAYCNGKNITGYDSMEVQPLSVWTNSNGIKYESFAGVITTKDLPPGCIDIDFTNGVALVNGTYASHVDPSPAVVFNLVLPSNGGTITNQFQNASMSNIEVFFRNSQNSSNTAWLNFWNPN